MKFDFVLSQEQQAMVESNLAVINKVISRCIHAKEGVCGLGRDDLYQEGAAALCKAAATYDGTSAQFSTYAATVIKITFSSSIHLPLKFISLFLISD